MNGTGYKGRNESDKLIRFDIIAKGFMDEAQDLSRITSLSCISLLFFSSKPALLLDFFLPDSMLKSDTTNVIVPKIMLPDPVSSE